MPKTELCQAFCTLGANCFDHLRCIALLTNQFWQNRMLTKPPVICCSINCSKFVEASMACAEQKVCDDPNPRKVKLITIVFADQAVQIDSCCV